MAADSSNRIRAVVYASDMGSEMQARLIRASLASMKKFIGTDIDYFVLTGSDEKIDGAAKIDPVPALARLGIYRSEWPKNKRLPFGSMYRFAVPAIPELAMYGKVLYLDSDTLAMSGDARRVLGARTDCEILAACDVGIDRMRKAWLIDTFRYDQAVRDETRRRIIEPTGAYCKNYVNSGVLVFNTAKILDNGLTFYGSRISAAVRSEQFPGLTFCDQEIINAVMDVDPGLSNRFNVLMGRPHDRWVSIAHYSGCRLQQEEMLCKAAEMGLVK